MIKKEKLLGFQDVVLLPAPFTDVESRSKIEDINKFLWVAPMDTVVGDISALKTFFEAGLNVQSIRGFWKTKNLLNMLDYPIRISLTLKEMEDFLYKPNSDIAKFMKEYHEKFGKQNILIDVANGHMKKVLTYARNAKKMLGGDLDLMVGNIAHPSTYCQYAKIGVDSVRLSIGTGSACLTSAKTSVHYPAISLIDRCYQYKKEMGYQTKIIMDGGIKDSSYIVKAFAAGADGVMMGSMFNKCLESSGDKFAQKQTLEITKNPLPKDSVVKMYESGANIFVSYRGMSTNKVQQKERGEHKKYEEGIAFVQKVEYTLDELLYELNYSIKSAFSYLDSFNIDEFKENAILYLSNTNNHNKL